MAKKVYLHTSKGPKFNEISQLIDGLGIDDKTKALWKEVYENATLDRERALVLYEDLVQECTGSGGLGHANHGITIAKYLERLEKSNAQLIKLSEMIEASKAEEGKGLSNDDLYNMMGNR